MQQPPVVHITEDDLCRLSVEELITHCRSLRFSRKTEEILREQNIDGQALLSLFKRHRLSELGLPLGDETKLEDLLEACLKKAKRRRSTDSVQDHDDDDDSKSCKVADWTLEEEMTLFELAKKHKGLPRELKKHLSSPRPPTLVGRHWWGTMLGGQHRHSPWERQFEAARSYLRARAAVRAEESTPRAGRATTDASTPSPSAPNGESAHEQHRPTPGPSEGLLTRPSFLKDIQERQVISPLYIRNHAESPSKTTRAQAMKRVREKTAEMFLMPHISPQSPSSKDEDEEKEKEWNS